MRGQFGFTYLGVLILVAIIGAASAATLVALAVEVVGADRLRASVRGAMCAWGVLDQGPWGLRSLALGATAAGGTLGILIPPSIAMVIYGIATQTSIGKLLIAGIVPGIVVGLLLCVMIYVWVRLAPHHAPEAFRTPPAERWASLRRVWPSLLLIALVIVMLYTGVATPSEIVTRPRFWPVERFISSFDITARRIWSATVIAERNTVFGSTSANSSPP